MTQIIAKQTGQIPEQTTLSTIPAKPLVAASINSLVSTARSVPVNGPADDTGTGSGAGETDDDPAEAVSTSFWGAHFDFDNVTNTSSYVFMDGKTPATRLPPPLDAAGNPIDLQAILLADITPEFFLSLHSSHQLELFDRFSLNSNPDSVFSGIQSLVIGSGDDRLDVLLSSDGRKVLIMQTIERAGLAQLRLADQEQIAKYFALSAVPDSLKERLANKWGVTLGDTLANMRAAALATLDDAYTNGIGGSTQGSLQNSEHRAVYRDQIIILQEQMELNALFSLSDLQAKADKIVDRFQRMLAFEEAARGGGDSPSISLDENETIKAGLAVFLEQETRMRDAQRQRLEIARVASQVDLPTLITLLQIAYDVEKEVDVALKTEELRQQNALLKDYAVMQALINDVLKQFPADAEEIGRTLDANGRAGGGTYFSLSEGKPEQLSVEHKRVLLMFDSSSGHPLEILRGISRVEQNLIRPGQNPGTENQQYLQNYNQSQWNIFSTQVADGVQLINQQSQILTNDISSLSQEQNRHFDFANSSLRRLTDMLTSIARA